MDRYLELGTYFADDDLDYESYPTVYRVTALLDGAAVEDEPFLEYQDALDFYVKVPEAYRDDLTESDMILSLFDTRLGLEVNREEFMC